MLMISGYITANDPVRAPALLETLRAGIARTRDEDGCLLYDFAMADADEGAILAVERWRDQASLDAHLAGPEIAELMGAWGDKITIDVKKHDVSNERGFGD